MQRRLAQSQFRKADNQMVRLPVLALLLIATALAQPNGPSFGPSFGLTPGPARLESAEALAFGPNGILFVGDSTAGAVYALDTRDHTKPTTTPGISITGIDQKIAALLGVMPSEVRFNDIKVNPLSKNIYLAISRGRGVDAIPVILRIDQAGAITELDTTNIAHSRIALPGLPASPKGRARRSSRALVITDLQYIAGKQGGQLVIAGLSNEDFSSTLRTVPFPSAKHLRAPPSRSTTPRISPMKPAHPCALWCPTLPTEFNICSPLTPARRS